MMNSIRTIKRLGIFGLLLLSIASCSSVLSQRMQPLFDLESQCWTCAGLKGEIVSDEYPKQELTQELYVAKHALIKTSGGVEINADQVALNTQTGVFMTGLMTGRITPEHVEVIIKKGLSVNVESKGSAHGDAQSLQMEGGASITMGQATVRAERIVVRYI